LSSLRFGLFELDTVVGELKHGRHVVRLRHQPAKVLALLAAEPGRVFTREEIQSAVWGPSTHVDFEQGLNYCIKEIRAALGDRAENPIYVETLARRGYRFIAPVERDAGAKDDAATAHAIAAPSSSIVRQWPRWAVAFGTAAAILVVGATWARARWTPAPSRVAVAVLPFANLSGSDDYEAFSAGLTEETQVQLGRLHPQRLAVIARTTTGGYALRPHPIGAMAEDLGVEYVLEGSVRHCSKHTRLRVTARLVRASNRRQIWSETIHQPLDDAVEMQRNVARELAARAVEALVRQEPRLVTSAAAGTPSPGPQRSEPPPR
jgi:TolB-like protein/DNA-binding winged helix-turn-helix (wHTH) protein